MKATLLAIVLCSGLVGCDRQFTAFDEDMDVVLNDGPMSLNSTQIELHLTKDLPVRGVNSGVCFVVGRLPTGATMADFDNVVKQSIGKLEFDAIPISSEVIGSEGKRYTLTGSSYGGRKLTEDGSAFDVTICKLFCPCAKPPHLVKQIFLRSSRPFNVKRVFWSP